AGVEGEDVFLRRLGIHRDQKVDFLLSTVVPAFARTNRVPGRKSRDVGREHVLARYRYTHEEDRSQQDEVGGLAARSVDGGDLETEIVDDALFSRCDLLFLNL